MKIKGLKKKMSLNKITISHLDENQAMAVMGGQTDSCYVSVCILCQPTRYTCNTCNTCYPCSGSICAC